MDYRALLKKYIEHVGVAEGTDFLADSERGSWTDSPEFTDEEWRMLQVLRDEEDDKQPMLITLPEKLKPNNKDEVIITIAGHTQIFYKE